VKVESGNPEEHKEGESMAKYAPMNLETLKQILETQKTAKTLNVEILNLLADIEKDIGELSIAMIAQHSALCELLPDFESRYASKMANARVLHVKRAYEHRIRVLRERASQL
jgi:predicted transcriptional regulator